MECVVRLAAVEPLDEVLIVLAKAPDPEANGPAVGLVVDWQRRLGQRAARSYGQLDYLGLIGRI
jgi:hypothetical protein